MSDRRRRIADAVFQAMDVDDQGFVTAETFANQCRPENFDKVKFGKQGAAQFIGNVISLLNPDSKGRVSVEEWMAFCADLR